MRVEDPDSYASTIDSVSDLDLKERVDHAQEEHTELEFEEQIDLITDDHYNNPEADLSLVAMDETCFHVDAWTMSKKSEFIKTQMALSPGKPIENGIPIELGYSTEVVRMFIDVMYSRHDIRIDMSVPQFKDLFQLCDDFQAPEQDAAIARALRERFTRQTDNPLDPWDVFKLAAQRDNLEIAKLAASKLQENDRSLSHLVLANPPSFFDGVPPKYVYALVRSAVWYHDEVKLPWGGTGGTWIKRGPADIADAFKLD